MACRINAVNRWAVSGTPIGRKGLTDLGGMLTYLSAGREDFEVSKASRFLQLAEIIFNFICVA
jgi:hypothetical protein